MKFVYCAFQSEGAGEERVRVCATVEVALTIPDSFLVEVMPLLEHPDQIADGDAWTAEQQRVDGMRLVSGNSQTTDITS